MVKLIEALQILLKYGNPNYPTHYEHDVMRVMISPLLVSKEDKKRLEELGFDEDCESECFRSYVFGSA